MKRNPNQSIYTINYGGESYVNFMILQSENNPWLYNHQNRPEYKILNTTNEEDAPLLSKLNKGKGDKRQDPPCSKLQELWPWHPFYQHSKMHPQWDYWCLLRKMEKNTAKQDINQYSLHLSFLDNSFATFSNQIMKLENGYSWPYFCFPSFLPPTDLGIGPFGKSETTLNLLWS